MNSILNELKSYTVDNLSWNRDWEKIKDTEGDFFLSEWGFRFLTKGLSESLKCIILEPSYTCKDHRNLFSNFYSKKLQICSAYTNRIHFFDIPNIDINDLLIYSTFGVVIT